MAIELQTQILINLLSNAIKFTPSGGKVSVFAGLSDDNCMEITVVDTGIGMNSERLRKDMKDLIVLLGRV